MTCVQVWSVHMHFNVKGFKIITLHSNFQIFLQHFTKLKTWYGIGQPFRIEYENIEEAYAIKWCTNFIFLSFLCNALNYHPTPKAKRLFGEAFTVVGGNFAKHIFVKCPILFIIYYLLWFSQPKWHLTGVEDSRLSIGFDYHYTPIE